MHKPALPPNEAERLAALHALKILDTPPEERFDRITRIAQRLFDVPIALVSLVDANRQWFKSRQGLEASETPRDISFCGHAILGDDVFVVPDTQQDLRFCDNPMVTGEPKIVFYAGCPLTALDGSKLGTLCIKDRRPRQMSPAEIELIRDLAAMVEDELNAVELTRRLAEKMAERLEAERRAAYEMEIAKQVQRKLFPQKAPALATLEYAGACIEARAVGGDYYDFLDLGPGRLGLVLADIAGKGISGALLMANLQANLRSQCAGPVDNLAGLLQSLNQVLYEFTEPSHYATLFFGDYTDGTHRLRYANCGHNPPLLLRREGTLERLPATATVLGLFEEWECSIAEVELSPGDILVVFSDGITEAMRDTEEEFGEARLLGTLWAHYQRPATSLLSAIVDAVQQFSKGEQEDDLTLVVARARSPG